MKHTQQCSHVDKGQYYKAMFDIGCDSITRHVQLAHMHVVACVSVCIHMYVQCTCIFLNTLCATNPVCIVWLLLHMSTGWGLICLKRCSSLQAV